MKRREVILIGLGLAALYWVFDSIVMVLLFDSGNVINQIFMPDLHDVWMRSAGAGVIFALSIYTQLVVGKRNLVEQALRDSREKYQVIFDEARDGIVLIDGQAGYIVDCNSEYERQTGRKLEQLRKMKVWELYPPELMEEAKELSFEINNGNLSGSREFRFQRPDGVTIPIEFESRVISIGGRQHICSIVRDITERKRAEEILQESERKYRSLFSNMFDGFAYCKVLVDENNQPIDFVYLEVNDAFERLTGLKREDIIGRKVNEAIPGTKESHPELFSIYGKVALTGEPTEFDIYFKPLGIWLTISVYCPRKGYFAAVFENITERRRAEEQLRSSHEQLRALSAHLQSAREEERKHIAREVHDELGQSLTVLKMDLSWLGKRLPEEQTPLLEKTKTMIKLVDNTMKTVRRIATELRPGLLDDLGLMAAVEWQAEEFKNLTGIRCQVTSKCDGAILGQDLSTAIFRILQEALLNVARHSSATKVRVSLTEENSSLVMEVSDNGKGITRKEIANPKSLGLVGMRERALLFGGEVNILGIPGKGTTVTVNTPLNGEGAA